MSIIEDGTGTGNRAEVNSKNRLKVNSVAISDSSQASIDGRAFFTSTTTITLTSDSASDLIYLKNTGLEDILISSGTLSVGTSTGGSGVGLIEYIKNPITGTVVSDAVDVTVVNVQFGSTKLPSVDVFQGAEGKTLTGGSSVGRIHFGGPGLFATQTFPLVLPPGTSTGIRFTPQPGNTSMDVIAGFSFHLDGFED